MVLTKSEEKVLEWLSEKREEGRGRVSWSDFTQKVTEVTGTENYEDIDEDVFSFNLIGVTVSMKDGEEMYPIRDLEQGITRGYSTD